LWLLVIVIFVGQLAIIFWLGDRRPVLARHPGPAPLLRLAGTQSSEVLQLEDPTLFARPHWDAFSGPAWVNVQPNGPPAADFTEPLEWLELPAAELGAAFNRFVQTNHLDPAARAFSHFEPEPTMPPPVRLVFASERSSFRVEGSLAGRRLLTPLDPPVIEHKSILTNSVVQLVVDEQGWPLSVALLSGSGSAAADTNALALARAARFESLYDGAPEPHSKSPRLAWGALVFEWAVTTPARK